MEFCVKNIAKGGIMATYQKWINMWWLTWARSCAAL